RTSGRAAGSLTQEGKYRFDAPLERWRGGTEATDDPSSTLYANERGFGARSARAARYVKRRCSLRLPEFVHRRALRRRLVAPRSARGDRATSPARAAPALPAPGAACCRGSPGI